MRGRIAYLLAVSLAVTATPSFAEWAAVSVNKEAGQFGYSNRQRNKGGAKARASFECVSASDGVGTCEVELFTRNCFAISTFEQNVYVADAASKSLAARRAEELCNSNHGAACVTARAHQHCAAR